MTHMRRLSRLDCLEKATVVEKYLVGIIDVQGGDSTRERVCSEALTCSFHPQSNIVTAWQSIFPACNL